MAKADEARQEIERDAAVRRDAIARMFDTDSKVWSRRRGHQVRRLLNQAFFTRILVQEESVSTELAEPFETLLSADMAAAARQHARSNQNDRQPDGSKLLTSRQANLTTQKPAPLGAGLNVTTLVRAERIELSSLAWKAGILAIIRRPHVLPVLDDYSAKMLQYKVLAIT